MDLREADGIPYDWTPGVSAMGGAAAALGMEYTLPGISQSVVITRMAGRTPVPERESIEAFAAHGATMVLFLSAGMTEKLSERLIAGGYSPDTPAAIVYKATWPEEAKYTCTVGTLAQTAAAHGITKTALIIVGDAVAQSGYERSRLYDPGFETGFRAAQEQCEGRQDTGSAVPEERSEAAFGAVELNGDGDAAVPEEPSQSAPGAQEQQREPAGGTLSVVGMGPGAPEMMTLEAYRAIEEADVIAGYKTYVDLIRDRFPDKKIVTTPMRREEERCELALREAAEGQKVAFICSGDAGVYGMAGLLLEMAQGYPSVEIRVVPGVTAALSGAARLGAPLIHDFAVISLSDLLTPWETIEKRLRKAAEGDYAIVLYNPASRKRADYLRRACDILLETLPGGRVCGLVRNVGRDGESARVCTLLELRDAQADMFTTVFVGNSSTRRIGDKIVTPRGYALEKAATRETARNSCADDSGAAHSCADDSSGAVLIFGGTTEGRLVAERLLAEGVSCTVSVATQYGEEVLAPHPLMSVRTGRLDRDGMAKLMREGGFSRVIDATHPFAQIVSKEIEAACRMTGIPYERIERDLRTGAGGKIVRVRDVAEAGTFLAGQEGRVLVTTGSKELGRFAEALGDPSRITARVLPSPESLRACEAAGLIGKQICAMQGPFDTQMNCALIRHTGAQWLVTKESGAAGGYPEKIEAARQCGIGVVVIESPREKAAAAASAAGTDVILAQGNADGRVGAVTAPGGPWMLSLVGIGVGAPAAVTEEARSAVEEAEVLFGAKSVLETARRSGLPVEGKTVVPVYDADAILSRLGKRTAAGQGPQSGMDLQSGQGPQLGQESQSGQGPQSGQDSRSEPAAQPRVRSAAVLFSGDSGFYSGAAAILDKLRGRQDAPEVRVICGISCVSWFAARAGIPWQDWKILSSHGRFCNVVGQVRRNPKCFLLLSGAEDLRRTGRLLADAQVSGMLGELRLIYGYELSRPAEKIRACTAEELSLVQEEGRYVLYIEHEAARRTPVLPGLSDSAFVRGKVPMTSSEIRALSLSRLGLTAQSVLWDVGAGTGSVSIEAALTCPEGKVWSVECGKEAVELLTQNREKFCLENMEIVEGRAPEALAALPAPTHVFIGGSGGEIAGILECALAANPSAWFVVNCITFETLAALRSALERLPVRDMQCAQVSVYREEMLGRYHRLRPQNPVFIVSFQGREAGPD